MTTTLVPIERIMRFISDKNEYRDYRFEGDLYLFRNRLIGDGLLQTQYGRLNDKKNDLSVDWYDCPEKAAFSRVQPFCDKQFDMYAVEDILSKEIEAHMAHVYRK